MLVFSLSSHFAHDARSQKPKAYSWIVFKFCLGTLCQYFIDSVFWTDHVSLYKLDLSYVL